MIFISKFCKSYVPGRSLEEVWLGGSFVALHQTADDTLCARAVHFLLEGRKGHSSIEQILNWR